MSRLILASGSPRRKEILERNGHDFVVIKAVKDECSDADIPADFVSDLSRDKAMEVLDKVLKYPDTFDDVLDGGDTFYIIAADTVVAVDKDILGKPEDRADAVNMIRRISGRAHSVYTGVTIIRSQMSDRGDIDNTISTFYDETLVYVQDLSDSEISAYVDMGECMDKAGAYAIQGGFGKHIDRIEGDYDNVVGLPYYKVYEALKELGYYD